MGYGYVGQVHSHVEESQYLQYVRVYVKKKNVIKDTTVDDNHCKGESEIERESVCRIMF
jgi:hypothetical protein